MATAPLLQRRDSTHMTNSDPTTAPAPVLISVSVDVDSVVALAAGRGVVLGVNPFAVVGGIGTHAPGLIPPHPELYCLAGHEVGH